jgi:hypothetical protein
LPLYFYRKNLPVRGYEFGRHQRNNWRIFWRLLAFSFWLTISLVVAGFAYQFGSAQYKMRESYWQEQLAHEVKSKAELEQSILNLQAAITLERLRAEKAEEQYEKDVPKGALKTLQALINTRLAEGVSLERLRFLLEQAGKSRLCGTPQAQFLAVMTPASKGPTASATFANGLITVIAEGVNEQTRTETKQWFDARQPISVRFTVIGAVPSKASGVLPLTHGFLLGEEEYQFIIQNRPTNNEKEKGMITITAARCSSY